MGKQLKSRWPAVGSCSRGLCGKDAACHNHEGHGTYSCICPHDSTPPTSNLQCPNRRTVTETPQAIPIVIPNGNVNVTSNSSLPLPTNSSFAVEDGTNYENDTLLYVAVGTASALLALIICILIIVKCRKYRKKSLKEISNMDSTPIPLNKALLETNRFTYNPQYLNLVNSIKTIPNDKVTFIEAIGEGCFGKVYKGELNSEGNRSTVAIKVLKDSAGQEAQQDFMREVEIMSSFNHLNILSLIGICHKELSKCPWMVFEFMPYGDLTEVLRSNSVIFRKNRSNLPLLNQEGLISVSLQIANGMNYLAAQHFVHRDLASRNCLVGDHLTVKIADFGMSRDVYTCDYYKIGGSRLLPVRWMSPESITYGRFTLESDIWSYGVVLWEVFSYGKQPYFGHSNEQVVEVILGGVRLTAPEDCPPAITELMSRCWKSEPKDRITFPSICSRLESLAGGQLPLPPSLHQTMRLDRVDSTGIDWDSEDDSSASESLGRGPVSPSSQLDSESYLRPNPSAPPHQYLETFVDSPFNSAVFEFSLLG